MDDAIFINDGCRRLKLSIFGASDRLGEEVPLRGIFEALVHEEGLRWFESGEI
jgi:hypothetical protein